MSADSPLNIVLCWHMHQPQYCDQISGTYQLPWTYLHATKDYIDMAAHLEAVPEQQGTAHGAGQCLPARQRAALDKTL